MKEKISTRQLAVITAVGFTVTKLHALPAMLAGMAGESLWIAAAINLIADFILLCAALKITAKYPDCDLFGAVKNEIGKIPAQIIFVTYAVYFLVKSIVPIAEQKNSIELTFYETQPTVITFMPFFFIAFYIVIKGYLSFARSMEICLWLFIAGMAITILLSAFSGNYARLLPIIPTDPIKTAKAAYNTLFWFGDPLYVAFFCGKIKRDKNHDKRVIDSYLIYCALVIVLLVVFYAVFGSIAQRQYYATLKMSKYAVSLSDIGRFDFIAALLLAGTTVYQVTLPLAFASECLNCAFALKRRFVAPTVIISVSACLTLIVRNDFFKAVDFMQSYASYFFIVLCYILPVLFAVFKRRKNDIQKG